MVTGSLGLLPGQTHDIDRDTRSNAPVERVSSDGAQGKTVLLAAKLDIGSKHVAHRRPTSAGDRDPAGPTEPGVEPSVDPEPTPTPEPSEPPAPEPTPPVDGGSTDPEPTPPPAEPAGYTLNFGSSLATEARCSCLWDTKVESETAWVRDDGMYSYSQTAQGTASSAGTPSYGLWLQHSSSNVQDQRVEFALYTEQGAYRYSASGALTSVERTEWGGWIYRYAGTYSLSGRPANEIMPTEGSYTAEVAFSVNRSEIVSTTFSVVEG
jgi:hypothetical protein